VEESNENTLLTGVRWAQGGTSYYREEFHRVSGAVGGAKHQLWAGRRVNEICIGGGTKFKNQDGFKGKGGEVKSLAADLEVDISNCGGGGGGACHTPEKWALKRTKKSLRVSGKGSRRGREVKRCVALKWRATRGKEKLSIGQNQNC